MNTTENTISSNHTTNNDTSNEITKEKGIIQMPDDARVWIYQSDKILSDLEVSSIKKKGVQFIDDWSAHGASLKASFDVLYNLFIVIAVDEKQAQASGCSIDKGVHFVKHLEKQFNLNLLDRMQVAYRDADEIKTCHLNNLLEELTRAGLYSENTDTKKDAEIIVFNNMITTKKQFDNEWEINIKQSWQNRVFL